MSDFSLDDPGFMAPSAPPSAPPSSGSSSVGAPPDVRRNCIACPRRMSKKTADRHTLCISCRGFDCDFDTRCEECIEWLEGEIRLYAKYRKSLKSKTFKSKSSAPPPPPADSVPSPRGNIESRVESLSATVATLAEFVHFRLDALTASLCQPSLTQVSSQPRLGPDVRDPHPGSTAGYHLQSQALGGPDRTPAVPPTAPPSVSQGVRAPPEAAPGPAPRPSAASANRPPPPGFEVPPSQPSTSGWVPSGPPPSRSAPDSRTSSELEDSDTESVLSWRDSASSRLANLIFEVCPESRPLADAAVLRPGSASQSLRLPVSASGFTPGSRRWSRRCLFVRRLWLVVSSPSHMFYHVGCGSMRWLTTHCMLPRCRLTLLSRSSLGPDPYRPSVGVPSPFRRWSGWSVSSRISWR